MFYWAPNSVASAARIYYESGRGGDFAALEAPDLLAEDVREFFASLR